ncbi:MAG: MurT ligase domain-containing protein [Erysipelotrichaceae bacterium]
MRTTFIIVLTKCIRFILKLFNRGGSLPGFIALKAQSDFLSHITYPKIVIMITGTNGKTTTSNMIYETFEKTDLKVIGNRKGDNMKAGIASLVIGNVGLNKCINCDVMVMEVDELNVPKVMKEIKPTVFVIHNFFRDQLDRAGEMESVLRKIMTVLPDYEGTLVINGDDPNVVRLGDAAIHAKKIYVGVGENSESTKTSKDASEGKFCYKCNELLAYHYYQYSHIGKFYCPNHDFGDIKLDLQAEQLDFKLGRFMVDHNIYKMPQSALFSVYNCMSVLGVCKALDLDEQYARDTFETFALNDGRNETFILNHRPCILNLVKNPTGANETMKVIQRDEDTKDILIILNDNDQDGTDVSWIWDAHFEMITTSNVAHIICSGKRGYDMALRLKYEDYQGNLSVYEEVEDALNAIEVLNLHAYVIATYTALQPIRALLGRKQ